MPRLTTVLGAPVLYVAMLGAATMCAVAGSPPGSSFQEIFALDSTIVAQVRAAMPGPVPDSPGTATPGHVAAERSGSVPTHDDLQLTFTAGMGSVRVFTDAQGEVSYRVRVEARSDDAQARAYVKGFSVTARGSSAGVTLTSQMPAETAAPMTKPHDAGDRQGWERVSIRYELHVPRRYNLEIRTGAGDIVTQDVDGRVVLSTGGGNIQAGRVGFRGESGGGSEADAANTPNTFVARLETAGGHILVGDVAGGLRAETAGGHITAGDVHGDAVLHTAGGHIHVGRISGTAQMTTGGGNIVAERADAGVIAESGGGRIELAEAGGAIRARTGGGGVRIAHVAGPAQIDAGDSGVILLDVEAPVHVATATGGISAWFSQRFGNTAGRDRSRGPAETPSRAASGSELLSRQGDIVVYLPRDMAVNIDALIDGSAGHHIVADPSVPLKVSYEDSKAGPAVHGLCALNGGGAVLRLRTTQGDIQLRFLDPAEERRLAAQQTDNIERTRAAQKALVLEMERQTADADGPLGNEPGAKGTGGDVARGQFAAPGGLKKAAASPVPAPESARDRRGSNRDTGRDTWWRDSWWQDFWRGGVPVDSIEQQGRLRHSIAPEYPDAARQAGIEGEVSMRVAIDQDGVVTGIKLLDGEPVLARAAMEAVEQWRYAPALLDGAPVSVVTTVTIAFQLQ